jgi:uncharacterized protein
MSEKPAFTAAQADFLRSFLSAPGRPEGTMSYEELAGFLFALSCVPEMLPPTEWMPLVFNEGQAGFADAAESEQFLDALMALHDRTIAEAKEGTSELPIGCAPLTDPLANFDDAPLGRWSQGFASGHRWMSDWWPNDLPQEHAEDLSAILLILTFFSSRTFADSYLNAMEQGGRTMEEMAAHILAMHPEAMRAYAAIAEDVALVSNETQEPAHSNKIGRNDPCPCGSGKKYKKCCGTN